MQYGIYFAIIANGNIVTTYVKGDEKINICLVKMINNKYKEEDNNNDETYFYFDISRICVGVYF
jgi:hypothetical protein